MKLSDLAFISLIFVPCIFSQPLSKKSFNYKIQKNSFDFGRKWHVLSSISSIQFSDWGNIKSDSSKYYNNLEISINEKNNLKLYQSNKIILRKYFYCYFDLSLTKESYYLNNNKNIIDLSGFGFQNDWALIQIGRGREDWGAGNDIALGISGDSKAYDYLLLSSNYGKIRVNYIHGFLETTSENINRYITARGVEWTNKESLVVSLSETVIYSGPNRNIDIAYLNPISSHLELELNNRLNYPNNFNANAVWQLHFDYLFRNSSRLSINYLIDEFVLDPDIEIGKEHGKAYSLKYVFPFFNIRNENLRFNFSRIYVGTPTYRHGNGFNNFRTKRRTPWLVLW